MHNIWGCIVRTCLNALHNVSESSYGPRNSKQIQQQSPRNAENRPREESNLAPKALQRAPLKSLSRFWFWILGGWLWRYTYGHKSEDDVVTAPELARLRNAVISPTHVVSACKRHHRREAKRRTGPRRLNSGASIFNKEFTLLESKLTTQKSPSGT